MTKEVTFNLNDVVNDLGVKISLQHLGHGVTGPLGGEVAPGRQVGEDRRPPLEGHGVRRPDGAGG